MNYHKQYRLLLLKARSENRKKLDRSDASYTYYEEHHVLPVAMGGDDSPHNLVLLTAREHFVAHWLLTKFTTGQDKYKMLSALSAMSFNKSLRKLTPRQYEASAKAQSVAAGELQNALLAQGLHNFQNEICKANRKAACDELANRDKLYFQTAEGKLTSTAMAKAGKLFAQTDEGKAVLSTVMQNTMAAEVQCPHCLAIGKRSVLQNSHFAYCEANKDELAVLSRKERTKRMQYECSQKTYTCPHCCKVGKGVAMQRYHFSNCTQIVTGSCCDLAERPAKGSSCSICLQWFSTKGGLTKHIRKGVC